jgi:peptidoglycan/LPS O-acetylase OafA/YrhL
VAAFVGERILLYFLIWLLGVAAVLTPVPAPLRMGGLVRRVAILALGGALLASLAASKLGLLSSFAGDIAVGSACAALVWALQSAGPITRPSLARLAPKLAGFSYTLYLAHLPPLVFGTAAVVAAGGARWQPDAIGLAAGLVIASAVLAYSYALSRITEAKTAWVRARLFGN